VGDNSGGEGFALPLKNYWELPGPSSPYFGWWKSLALALSLFLIDLNKKRSLTSPLPSREYDKANPQVNPDFRSISTPAGTTDFTRLNSVLRLSASPPRIS
jgi:hypothetical protein